MRLSCVVQGAFLFRARDTSNVHEHELALENKNTPTQGACLIQKTLNSGFLLSHQPAQAICHHAHHLNRKIRRLLHEEGESLLIDRHQPAGCVGDG